MTRCILQETITVPQGHSVESNADFNGPRIHLPFSFSLLPQSNENIEKRIVTIKLQHRSFSEIVKFDLLCYLENGLLYLNQKDSRPKIV